MNIVAFYNSSKIEKKVAFFMFIVDLQLNKRVKNPLALITLKIISLKTWWKRWHNKLLSSDN